MESCGAGARLRSVASMGPTLEATKSISVVRLFPVGRMGRAGGRNRVRHIAMGRWCNAT